MGSWFSRPSNENTETEVGNPVAFRYPPKSGNFFGENFIMGGERFESTQPEQYLFGDNSDLNFLGSKPIPFPYPAPQSNEPTKTLKALINIRKESIKFVKILPPPSASAPPESVEESSSSSSSSDVQSQGSNTVPPVPILKKPITNYNIEFVFDCDCRCEITIMYFCTEEVNSNGVYYRPRDPKMNSEPIKFKAGANQVYVNTEHVVKPFKYTEADLQFDFEKDVYPVVIHCVALEGDDPRQSHTTTAAIDKYSDGSYSIKPLKQKLFVDGLVYLLQEIYGIENKNASRKFDDDDSDFENASECVICMSDSRDTLILPCRHLCLCHACADSLRYQASNCPICRAPFRALLQIRAVYRIPPTPVTLDYTGLAPEIPVIPVNSIPGYEVVPLLEALNGPYQPSELAAAAAAANVTRQEAARMLNQGEDSGDSKPIAMTLMVSPSPCLDSDNEAAKGEMCSLSKTIRLEENPITIINELPVTRKGSSSAKLSKSSSVDAKTPVTSDPEDEIPFSEAVETLPDLQEFDDKIDATSIKSSRSRSAKSILKSTFPTSSPPDEDDMQLQSIEGSPVNTQTTNVLMIAAIDEFSDEEDTTRARKTNGSSSRMLTGRNFSESTQSTPKRNFGEADPASSQLSPEPSLRFSKNVPTSLPSTPNYRLSTPGTANSTSTRSSGDSFTSSSSTKQLLPTTSASSHHHQV